MTLMTVMRTALKHGAVDDVDADADDDAGVDEGGAVDEEVRAREFCQMVKSN